MLKKCKKTILSMVIAASFMVGTTAFAQEITETNVAVNDIIHTENGEEIVVSILDDGRFVTAPLELGIEPYAECSHSTIIGTGEYFSVSESYDKGNSTYCYKFREDERAKCARCGKTGFTICGKGWTDVKHKYKLFGKTCTRCGYEK